MFYVVHRKVMYYKEVKNIALIDKPAGWTSFDVVAKIRAQIRCEFKSQGETPTKKKLRVGHAGTLDPFATGLLIILLGDECKRAGDFLKLDKTYEFTAKLGEVSSTGDPEGAKKKVDGRTPKTEEVKAALEQFSGEIEQTPPAFSAIKIDGKRAYKLAREGKLVELPSRTVTISKIELLQYKYPYVKAVCSVSSGTYIRSLVEDIGNVLGTGAYCTQLRRLRIGDYSVDDSLSIKGWLANREQ
jgi:tRNA pseudouridine55 synthase